MRSRVRVPRRSRAAPARGAHALATDFPRRARFAKSRFSCRPHCTARAPLRRRHPCDDTRDELSRTRHPSTLTCATSSQFHSAARTTRAPRRRCACSTRWIGSNARPENNTSNSIVTTCLRVRLSRRAPSHGRRELRFAQANRFRCHFYEFICTYVSDSALEIYYLRWRQSNRFVVAARTHIC